MENLNRWIGTGNLTRDPELITLPSGTKLANLRLAVNSRVRREGEWTDKANYFDVTVFGGQAEHIKTYLSKGSPVAIDGRLDWNEWEDREGNKRQGVKIIADNVQFLPSAARSTDGGGGGEREAAPVSQAPAADDAFSGGFGAGDDDIPF